MRHFFGGIGEAAREAARTAQTRAGGGHAAPSTLAAGYRYAEMGYTSCFEPAVVPANAGCWLMLSAMAYTGMFMTS